MGSLFVIDGTDGSGQQTQFMKLQEKTPKQILPPPKEK